MCCCVFLLSVFAATVMLDQQLDKQAWKIFIIWRQVPSKTGLLSICVLLSRNEDRT